MDSSNAEKAWEEHTAQMYRAHPWIKPYAIRGRADFIVGYHARDAEVDALREQIAAAEAALADAWDEGFKQGGPMHDEHLGYRMRTAATPTGQETPMPEYTPTTENIRDCYVYSHEMYDGTLATPVRTAIAEFDRWLAAHDREVAARGVEAAQDRLVSRDQFSERTLRILDELAADLRSGTEGSTDV